MRQLITVSTLLALSLAMACKRGTDEAPENPVASSSKTELVPPPPPAKPAYWMKARNFTGNLELEPNLIGDLSGTVAFLQNTWVGPNRDGKKRPLLVADRAAYLLFFPKASDAQKLEVVLDDGKGETLALTLNRPEQGARSDFSNTDGRTPVVFSKRAWNVVIPWNFMHPGMSLVVRDAGGKEGSLPAASFEFGAPIELVTQHTELGMLLKPSDVPVNKWARPGQNISPELALDYFQMVPIAKLTVAQYLPIHLPKVVLPNGNVYRNRSTFNKAGIYAGDMRQDIAKGMISTGINLANVGIPSSIGGTERQPRPYRQTTVHTSAGMYTGKDKQGKPTTVKVVHGLSGGGGQLTLKSTTGNEFSHEYGHDHGLGHYPGGPLSTHRRDGAWGFNQFKHRLIANLDWNGKSTNSTSSYPFGKDAMAGGRPMGAVSVFTLHTPFSLMLIQQKISQQSGILDPDSPSGYSHWDDTKQALVPSEVDTPKPDKIGIPVVTLVGVYDPDPKHKLTTFIYPAFYGNWGNVFSPATIEKHDSKLAASPYRLDVTDEEGRTLRFPLHQQRLKSDRMNQFHINLDASVRYTRAMIRHRQPNGTEVTLDTREIAPPHGKLPEPVIVGREHGFTAAALRLRDMEQILTRNGYPSAAKLHQAMEDYYGRIIDYAADLRIDVGRVYRHDGSYYQARNDNPDAAPAEGESAWRKLGDTSAFLSTKSLALGEQSIDYAKEIMKGKSGVYFYVPVDHVQVLASDAPSHRSGKWYAKGSHSKLTVVGKKSDGSSANIVLRGQVNDRSVLNLGAVVDAPSRVRFRFHQEDNPDLPRGEFAVRFAAYAHGWHKRETVEAFEVRGTIAVD